MNARLLQVPPSHVDSMWHQLEEPLSRAVEHSYGTETVESAREQIKSGRRQLWIVVPPSCEVVAAGTTMVETYPTGLRTLHADLLGGDNIRDWFGLRDVIEARARDEGCSRVSVNARKGWMRMLPDYQLAHYVLHKEL
jgi:hypothetical protein